MAERITRRESWSYYEGVLADTEEAEKGHLAAIDLSSGEIVVGQTGTGLLVIGVFDETKTGDGTVTVRVRLSKEIWIDVFANDSAGTPVVAADVGSTCYVLDSETVTGAASGNSKAGRVWKVTANQVWVETTLALGTDPVA